MPGRFQSMFAYPWDLYDEGIPAALERIKELGIDRILLAASYHSGKFFLPHNPRKKIYYHGSGKIYFTPDISKYGLLKPDFGDAYLEFRERSGSGAADLLDEILGAAQSLGLEVYAWVVGFHNSRLGAEFPQYTVHNAFGESYRHALCPSMREPRRYVLQMIDDLARHYPLDGIVLESYDYMGMFHGDHHEIIATSCPNDLEKLMGICFCEGCRKNAEASGIDAEQLQSAVRNAVLRMCDKGEMADFGSMEGMESYLEMRELVVEGIYGEAKGLLHRSGRSVRLFSTLWMAGGADPRLSGVEPRRLDKYVDGWIVCYPSAPTDVPRFLARARRCVSESKLHGGIRLLPPETTSSEQVQRYAEAYGKEQVHRLCYYNYGLASNVVLDRLKWKGRG